MSAELDLRESAKLFRKQWLHEFLSGLPSYKATGLGEKKLSEIDRKNAEMIAQIGGPGTA